MALEHHDYNTDIDKVLGNKSDAKETSLRFGAEVETTWHSQGARAQFWKRLEAAGLDKVSQSKFDRSIGELGSEIVITHMPRHKQAATLEALGEIIEEMSEDVSMRNCGVHIHATRAAMDNDQLWRVVSAIMTDVGSAAHWTKQNAATEDEFAALNDFWTMLSLRRPTEHCNRMGYDNLAAILEGRSDHHLAVIRGHHTPTIEFRLFKTARNKRVLRSFVEIVDAIIQFSKAPPPELLHIPTKAPVDWRAKIGEISWNAYLAYARGQGIGADEQREAVERDALNRITQLMIRGYKNWNDAGAYLYYFTPESFLECLKYEGYVVHGEDTPGAVGWARGLFPTREFCKYVEENSRFYPALASRLRLDKFAPFRGGIVRKAEPFVFNTTEPHDAIRRGCIVKMDGKPNRARVQSVTDSPQSGLSVISAEDRTYRLLFINGEPCDSEQTERYLVSSHNTRGDFIIHLCPGAQTKEGHDE